MRFAFLIKNIKPFKNEGITKKAIIKFYQPKSEKHIPIERFSLLTTDTLQRARLMLVSRRLKKSISDKYNRFS